MLSIDKSWKELDFDEVDLDDGNWVVACVGSSLNNNEWVFIDCRPEIEIRYKMPDCISKMFQRQRDYGEEIIKRSLKSLLDID